MDILSLSVKCVKLNHICKIFFCQHTRCLVLRICLKLLLCWLWFSTFFIPLLVLWNFILKVSYFVFFKKWYFLSLWGAWCAVYCLILSSITNIFYDMKLWYNYLLACRVINLGSFPTMSIIYYLFLLFMHDFICYLCRYYMNTTPHLERFYTEVEWDTSFLGNTSIFCTVPFCGFAQFVYDHFVDCMSK